MAKVKYVPVHGYGTIRVISYSQYLKGDWQYEGTDNWSGYDVAFSYDRMEYVAVRIPEGHDEEDIDYVRY